MLRSLRLHCSCAILLTLALLILPLAAQATTIQFSDLYGTGVNDDGTLATAGGADLHYYFLNAPVSSDPSYPAYPNAFVTSQLPTQWLSTYWSGTMNSDYDILARWVSPQSGYPNQTEADPTGLYSYRTSFTIPRNVNLSTVVVYGAVSSDNCTQSIMINGHAVSGWSMMDGTCLSQAHYFQVGGPDAIFDTGTGMDAGLKLYSTYFQHGTNYIDFNVNNNSASSGEYNPSGLVVWAGGRGELAAPEPSTIGLILIGLTGLALRKFKRF